MSQSLNQCIEVIIATVIIIKSHKRKNRHTIDKIQLLLQFYRTTEIIVLTRFFINNTYMAYDSFEISKNVSHQFNHLPND